MIRCTGLNDATNIKRSTSMSLTFGRMAVATIMVGACATPAPPPSTQHLDPPAAVLGKAPEFAFVPPLPAPPKSVEKPDLYSVVVYETPVQDLLFALARDAKLNVSVHPGITGTVTMSVLDQTLTEVLEVIAKQVDIRYELKGKMLTINPDQPFLKIYRIDYPNIARNSLSSVSISTNVASTGGGPGSSGASSGSNASDSRITNTANNEFWKTLVANLTELLAQTDRVTPTSPSAAPPAAQQSTGASSASALPPQLAAAASAAAATQNTGRPAGSGGTPGGPTNATPATATAASTAPTPAAGAAVTPIPVTQAAAQSTAALPSPRTVYRDGGAVIANPENGVINVRATQRQHEKVREFLDGIMGNARRQVLIEATIVEVDLSDRYQQGIDWSLLRTGGSGTGTGITVTPAGPTTGTLTGGLLSSLTTLSWNKTSWEYSLTSALRLLESFGTLRVLSSPKVSVLNSQTSILKVVDNEVYFTISVTPGTPATATSPATAATYTTTINTVPVGFLMTVTPQISGHGEVILNLRPTISRISSFATDPSPALAAAGVVNRIPVVQSREMESILRVQSGDIAVLGGLIQDTRDRKTDGIPGLGSVPAIGELFRYSDNRSRKTELVIFLRPTVLTDSSLDGDFRNYRDVLPGARSAYTLSSDRDKPQRERP